MGGIVAGPPQISLLTLDRDISSRFTSNGTVNLDPVWSPDGSQIVFSKANNTGAFDLYAKPTTVDRERGTGPGDTAGHVRVGRVGLVARREILALRYHRFQAGLRHLGAGHERRPQALSRRPTRFEEKDAQFSPDGEVDRIPVERDRPIRDLCPPFPGGREVPVSTNGGAQVRWRRDGKELFYIALDGRLTAVPIRWIARPDRARRTHSIVRDTCRWRRAGARPTTIRRLPRRSAVPDEHLPGQHQPFADNGHPQLEAAALKGFQKRNQRSSSRPPEAPGRTGVLSPRGLHAVAYEASRHVVVAQAPGIEPVFERRDRATVLERPAIPDAFE